MYTGPFPAASNRATWTFTIEVIDDDTNLPVDLTGALIELAVGDPEARRSALLTGSTTDGKITIQSPATDGIFVGTFGPDDMGVLDANFYSVGVRLTVTGGAPTQLILATLPVVDGILDQ